MFIDNQKERIKSTLDEQSERTKEFLRHINLRQFFTQAAPDHRP